MITGLLVDVPTPFANDQIDEAAFAGLLTRLIEHGVSGLSPCGIVGEGSTLSTEERARLIDLTVEIAARRTPAIPSTGTNSTAETIRLTRQAKRSGADAVLIVVPYYSRPSQEGIRCHFDAVARAVDIPILVHHPIARTAVVLASATVARLAEIPAIVGMVDEDATPLRRQVIQDLTGDTFGTLCGADEQITPASLTGASGCLSSLANVAPALCVSLQGACAAHDYAAAFELQGTVNRFLAALGTVDASAALKFLLEQTRCGFSRYVRLPLTSVTEDAPRLRAAFDELGVWLDRTSAQIHERPSKLTHLLD